MNIQTPNDTAIFLLGNLGLLRVSGAGAQKLLQGQLTCDVDSITPEQGTMGAHCNPQGRIISLFYLLQVASDYYLLMPRALIPLALSALKKYAPFYKAELADVSDEWQITGSLTAPLTAAASMQLADGRYLALTPGNALTHHADDENWHDLDMHAGTPSLYPETSALFLPHDLNLTQLNAVSFTKGCFTGQEIIARMHYRGKPKNHLYRGLSATPLTPAQQLFLETRSVGTVVDCSKKRYNETYAFLLVADEASVATQQLKTEDGQLIKISI